MILWLIAAWQPLVASTPLACKNGIAYAEDLALGLPPACECTQCYEGTHCEDLVANCTVDASVVEVTVARSWFQRNAAAVREDLGATYHLDYLHEAEWLHSAATPDRISSALNRSILALHDAVGNVPGGTEDYQLVVGAGAMQVLSAAAFALRKAANSSCNMYAQPPYWEEFADIVEAQAPSARWGWPGLRSDCSIEIVTSPNNPDGRRCSPTGNSSRWILDAVYDWPSYGSTADSASAGVPTPELVVFSLSKLAGFAASRVGWAFVRDPAIAKLMSHYIFLNGFGAGVEAKYRAVRVLNAIRGSRHAEPPALSFFEHMRGQLSSRWSALADALSGQHLFSVDGVAGMPFAWVRCDASIGSSADCAALFSAKGLRVASGEGYGAAPSDPHVRIVMSQDQSSFDLALQRIRLAIRSVALAAV